MVADSFIDRVHSLLMYEVGKSSYPHPSLHKFSNIINTHKTLDHSLYIKEIKDILKLGGIYPSIIQCDMGSWVSNDDYINKIVFLFRIINPTGISNEYTIEYDISPLEHTHMNEDEFILIILENLFMQFYKELITMGTNNLKFEVNEEYFEQIYSGRKITNITLPPSIKFRFYL